MHSSTYIAGTSKKMLVYQKSYFNFIKFIYLQHFEEADEQSDVGSPPKEGPPASPPKEGPGGKPVEPPPPKKGLDRMGG